MRLVASLKMYCLVNCCIIYFLSRQNKRMVSISNLLGIIKIHQISSLEKDAGSGLRSTAFQISADIGLFFLVSLCFSTFYADIPASRGRTRRQGNEPLKRRGILRQRRGSSRLITVSGPRGRPLEAKTGLIKKRILRNASIFGVFFGPRKMLYPSRSFPHSLSS